MFAFDHADRLVSILSIDRTKRRQDLVARVSENPHPEAQSQTVLEPVGFIFGRIEFELHPL